GEDARDSLNQEIHDGTRAHEAERDQIAADQKESVDGQFTEGDVPEQSRQRLAGAISIDDLWRVRHYHQRGKHQSERAEVVILAFDFDGQLAFLVFLHRCLPRKTGRSATYRCDRFSALAATNTGTHQSILWAEPDRGLSGCRQRVL